MNRKLYLTLMILFLLVLSCGGGGGGGNISPSAPPSAPENILVSAGNEQIRLSWGNAVGTAVSGLTGSASGATTYNIYWSKTAGVTKNTGTKISAVTSPYYHSGLNNDTAYYYVITAANQYGESSESVEKSATPSPSNLPLPPTHVRMLALDRRAIVRWTAVEQEDANTFYNVYWSTTAGVTKGSGASIYNVVSPYVHENLINDTTYYYVVTTVNQRGESIESEEASATPNQGNIPAAPTGVTATAGNRQATISWDHFDHSLSYNIYWSTSADVSSRSGTKIAAITSPYIHTVLRQGTVYYYVITAVNGWGESADSASVSATIPDNRNDVCVALGDSITTGTGVESYSDTYVPRLSAALGKTVYNEGVAGTLSSYGAAIIDGILTRYNPMYITIFFGSNDVGFYDTDWIVGNLRTIIRSAKANGTTPVIATLPPVFGQWAWRRPSLIILNQRIRQLASEEGINCADLEAAFGWNSDYIISDGMHPNSTGHQIIANTFFNTISQ